MKLLTLLLIFLILSGPDAFASESLHYSGRLVNSNGSPVAGPRNIQMDLLSGTTQVCSLILNGTPLQNGVFNVELPFDTASCGGNSFSSVIADSITNNEDLFIQVSDGAVTYPKQMISTPPIAIYAKTVANGSLLQTNFSGIAANCPVGQVFLSNGSGGFSCGSIASSATPTGAAGGDLTGSYPNPQINTDAVLTTHIIDSAVTTNKIANGAVTGAKIAQMAALNGQVLKWNGTTWVPSGDAGITTESDPTVQGYAKNAPAVCLSNETLRFDSLLNSGAGGLFCAPFTTDDIPEGASKQFFTDARAKAATVSNAITDAVVDMAPSQNAVFDALALKADKNNASTDMTINSATVQDAVKFKEQPVNGTNYVGLKAPANVTADMVWTLPAADGSPNMALFTDGAGKLSWGAVGSSSMANGSITADKLDQMGAASGEVLKWNGSQWDPAIDEGIMYEDDPTVVGFAKFNPPICANDKNFRFDALLNSGAGGLYCAQNQFVDVTGGMNYPTQKIGIGVPLPQSKLDVAGTLSASSGTEYGTRILPTINQSSSAGFTSLLVNTVISGFGSGTQRLLDLQVGGVSKFSVDNNGNVISSSSTTGTTAEYTNATGPQLTVGSSSTQKMTTAVSNTGFATFNSLGTAPGYNFAGGNVGIGAAVPGEALDVTGSVRASVGVKTPLLSNLTDLTFTADSDNNTSGALIFNTGVNERIRVLNNGNVGIGTTGPGQKLVVEETTATPTISVVRNTNTGGSAALYLNAPNGATTSAGLIIRHFGSTIAGNSDSGTLALANTTLFSAAGTAGEFIFNPSTGAGYLFESGASALMRIQSDGKVGLGTTSPVTILDVTAPGAAGANVDAATLTAKATYTGGPSLDSTVGLNFNLFQAGGTTYTYGAIRAGEDTSTGAIKGSLRFLTQSYSGASVLTERMRISSAGNVGIGTTGPSTKLQVAGDVTIDSEVRFLENSVNGINYVGLRSPTALGGNVIWTLPATDGTAGLVLTTNGAGVMSWAQASSASVADGSITSAKIADGTIATIDIGDSQITSAKIADGNVVSADIGDGSIATIDIGDSQVTSAKIADGNVVSVDIGDGSIATIDIGDSQVTSAKIADGTIANVDYGAQTITDLKLSGIGANCGSDQIIKTNGAGSFYCGAGFTGSGTTNYLPKWTSASALGNSIISDNGATANINGNLSFSGANPSITSGGSYITIPYGAYFSGGTVYVTNAIQARGGVANDSGTTLVLSGGTSGITQANDLRANIFYDVGNTGYYLDPASVSILNDVRGTIFYDQNNTGYYIDPASTSITNDMRANIFYDQGNTGYYLDPAGTSNLNRVDANDMRSTIFYDINNTGYYVDPASTTILNLVYAWDLRSSIYYDRDNTGYYLDPASGSNLNTVTMGLAYVNDMRASIYYDKDNTGYYADPASTSNFNTMQGISFVYSSDKRLKKEIKPLPASTLQKILALKGVSFTWKESGKKDIGFIAQDVEKVYPDLVSTNEKTGMKAVQYGNLISPMIEAFKELYKTVTNIGNDQKELEREMASIKAENELLKKRLDEQEARMRRQEALIEKALDPTKK